MDVVASEFDLITAENSCKMSLIAKSAWSLGTMFDFGVWWDTLTFQSTWYGSPLSVFDYEDCDKTFELAKTNK